MAAGSGIMPFVLGTQGAIAGRDAGYTPGLTTTERTTGVMRIKRVFPLKEVDVTTMEPRTFEFAVAVAQLAGELRSSVPETITERLVQIGAEIGADVAEAQGRNGRETFVLKMNSARLGTKDIVYWLKLAAALEPGRAALDDDEAA